MGQCTVQKCFPACMMTITDPPNRRSRVLLELLVEANQQRPWLRRTASVTQPKTGSTEIANGVTLTLILKCCSDHSSKRDQLVKRAPTSTMHKGVYRKSMNELNDFGSHARCRCSTQERSVRKILPKWLEQGTLCRKPTPGPFSTFSFRLLPPHPFRQADG